MRICSGEVHENRAETIWSILPLAFDFARSKPRQFGGLYKVLPVLVQSQANVRFQAQQTCASTYIREASTRVCSKVAMAL